LSPSFGGINLEDIKAPECFMIEEKLIELMDIPVFHDDQHGTAIILLAGLINSLEITGRKLENIKVVVNGPGAAGLASTNLLHSYGLPKENIVLCDERGVLFKGRKFMNTYQENFATTRSERTLEEALKGADVFIGLSVGGALKKEYLTAMNPDPIIFAMANPTPEIDPKLAREVWPGAIIATGRSDYPNQVNNVMCFPFLFRGTLDCRSSEINY
jgi:malate dehydrogenase (oxaloacetate-decarboxylating)(NADP+)